MLPRKTGLYPCLAQKFLWASEEMAKASLSQLTVNFMFLIFDCPGYEICAMQKYEALTNMLKAI